MKLLDENVQVHNIFEEHDVGRVDYKLKIRGKDNLKTAASRKIVLNSCSDLIDYIKPFQKQSIINKQPKREWNEKMKKLQQKGFN